METPENNAEQLPEKVSMALDRELISPENTLFMCGVSADELADHFAEFDALASQEALELSAYRVAEILDTITDQINELAIQNLGKEFLYSIADLVISQVVIEERAIVRHTEKAPDHNCEQESCPFSATEITRYSFEYEPELPAGSATPTRETLMSFDSEWD